jgi:hypothetical protein
MVTCMFQDREGNNVVLYRYHILLRGERQLCLTDPFNLQILHRFSTLLTWLFPSSSSLKFRETSPSVWPTFPQQRLFPNHLSGFQCHSIRSKIIPV